MTEFSGELTLYQDSFADEKPDVSKQSLGNE